MTTNCSMEVEADKNGILLPLAGQVLFASVRRKRINECELQKNIQKLGGKLENFFSHEITCVLTDEIPVCGQTADRPLKRSPDGKPQVHQMKRNSVVDKARLLGIQVMRIETFLTWLRLHVKVPVKTHEVRKTSNAKHVTKLNGCFMKIESNCQNYSPLYKVYSSEPEVDFEKLYHKPVVVQNDVSSCVSQSSKSKSPFMVSIKLPEVEDEKNQNFVSSDKISFSGSSSEPAVETKAKRHYCECCKIYFTSLDRHLKGPQHMKFVSKMDNFKELEELMGEIPSVAELRDKITSSLHTTVKSEVKSEHGNSCPVENAIEPVQYEGKWCDITNRNDDVPSDNLTEILKVEDFGTLNTDCNDLKRILSPTYLCNHDKLSANETFNEKSLLKEDLCFSDLLPSDILPNNDRLFSSDISDDESVQQNVLDIIHNVFDDDTSNDNACDSILISKAFQYESDPSMVNISSILDSSFLEGPSELSPLSEGKQKQNTVKDVCFESWSIRPISDIKMLFVRCSVLPSMKSIQLGSSENLCDMWAVKNVKDTKVVLKRSKLDVSDVST